MFLGKDIETIGHHLLPSVIDLRGLVPKMAGLIKDSSVTGVGSAMVSEAL